MKRNSYVIGNWKMNGSKALIASFFPNLVNKLTSEVVTPVICPPAPYFSEILPWLNQMPALKLGAQDVSEHESGAYTGQISAAMLVEHQCKYVIIGHSERREYCHESAMTISLKFFAAKWAGLTPILCIGETKAQRDDGLTKLTLVSQVEALLKIKPDAFEHAILAYEPIWAIGSGLSATPEQAQEVHHLLRQTVAAYDATVASKLPIVYGGSVKSSNANNLFEMPDIDGALVGGASLEWADFLAIYKAAG